MKTKHVIRRMTTILLSLVFVISICAINTETVSASTKSAKFGYSSAYKSSKYYKRLKNVVLTGDQRVDIVNIALSQVGYHEGNSKSGYSGTKSGSRNYTEYGRAVAGQHLGWCGYFVTWCANQAGVSTSVIKKNGIPTASDYGLKLRKKSSYKPVSGDLIFFTYRHVGLVYKVTSKYVYTVEGNSSQKVEIRKYSLKSGEIKGYGVPKYTTTNVINYVLNGGKNNAKNVASYLTTATLYAPTKTGYTFAGWYTNKNFTGSKVTKLTKKSVTLYAKWVANSYTISLNANGGKGSMSSVTAYYGKEVTLDSCTYTKEGYAFAGWSTSKEGTNPSYSFKNLTAKKGGKVTLYAVWKAANSSSITWNAQEPELVDDSESESVESLLETAD